MPGLLISWSLWSPTWVNTKLILGCVWGLNDPSANRSFVATLVARPIIRAKDLFTGMEQMLVDTFPRSHSISTLRGPHVTDVPGMILVLSLTPIRNVWKNTVLMVILGCNCCLGLRWQCAEILVAMSLGGWDIQDPINWICSHGCCGEN
jgi:hypothetical protein